MEPLADQSIFVLGAIRGVVREALIAACLTASGLLTDQALDIPINISMGMDLNDGKPFDFTTPSFGRIRVKALWVQFDDGSQWGDTAAGQKLLKQRAEQLQFY